MVITIKERKKITIINKNTGGVREYTHGNESESGMKRKDGKLEIIFELLKSYPWKRV